MPAFGLSNAPPVIPGLGLSNVPAAADGLRSSRISMHTPRPCQHTPRRSSTFSVGGPLGEPFLNTHRTGVYFNPDACKPPELSMSGAQSHLPAAYAVVRLMLEPEEEATPIWQQLSQSGGPKIQKFNATKDAFAKRFPALVRGVQLMKEAFGRYLELPAEELARVGLQDVRCVKFAAGTEASWHRGDARSHFTVMVVLSDDVELKGGTLMLHGGECTSDGDAMPVHMTQGDAVIFCAPRLDHAIRRIEHGELFMALFEFGMD